MFLSPFSWCLFLLSSLLLWSLLPLYLFLPGLMFQLIVLVVFFIVLVCILFFLLIVSLGFFIIAEFSLLFAFLVLVLLVLMASFLSQTSSCSSCFFSASYFGGGFLFFLSVAFPVVVLSLLLVVFCICSLHLVLVFNSQLEVVGDLASNCKVFQTWELHFFRVFCLHLFGDGSSSPEETLQKLGFQCFLAPKNWSNSRPPKLIEF